MTYETFIDRKFRAATLLVIDQANTIIAEYQAQGYILTLRQLYYQFVARDLLPNTEHSYGRVGTIVNDARLAGYIDWQAIEDRTRGVEINSHWESPKEGIETLRNQYRIDMWENQPHRVEVWIEKEALVGVIDSICIDLDVPYLACRGYVSQSEQWRAYRRILHNYEEYNQRTIILHFGDHDPSGIDMTRDNQDRLTMFLNSQYLPDANVAEVRRLALNMDQIRKYNPPPNPAKTKDSRFRSYAARYGDQSWELDALEPTVMAALIKDHVRLLRDKKLWAVKLRELSDQTTTLNRIIDKLP